MRAGGGSGVGSTLRCGLAGELLLPILAVLQWFGIEELRQRYPPKVPLVEGTSPFARGSIATAARSARASPLKHDSDI
jgi:hypothetical protein